MIPFNSSGGGSTPPNSSSGAAQPSAGQQMGHPSMQAQQAPPQGMPMQMQGMQGMAPGMMQPMMFNPLLMQQQMAMMAQQNPQLLMQMQQMMHMQLMQQQQQHNMHLQQQHQHHLQHQQQHHMAGQSPHSHSQPPSAQPGQGGPPSHLAAASPTGGLPAAGVGGPQLPFNPAIGPMMMGGGMGGGMGPMGPMGPMGFAPQGMAGQMMGGGGMGPGMAMAQPQQMMGGRPSMSSALPPLPPQTLAPLPPSDSLPSPSPSDAAPDAFAALDERSSGSPLPDLPGAPLHIKAAQAPKSSLPSKASTAAAAESDEYGQFQSTTTAPAPLTQPHPSSAAPQQMRPPHGMPSMQPQMQPMQGMMPGMQGMHGMQGMMPGMQGMQGMGGMQAPGAHPGLHGPMQLGLQGMQPQQPMMGMWSNQQQPHSAFPPQHPPQGGPPFLMGGAPPPGPFSPFQSPPPTSLSSTVTTLPPPSDEDFEAEFHSASPAPAAGLTTAPASVSSHPFTVEDDDDFAADFESAPASSVAVGAVSPAAVPPVASPSPSLPSPSAPPATPVPAVKGVDDLLHLAFDKAFDHSKANAPLVDLVPMAALHPVKAAPQPVIPHHRGRDLPQDLDDLLNAMMPEAKVQDAPLPTLPLPALHRPDEALDTDFAEFASANTTTAPQSAEGEAASTGKKKKGKANAIVSDEDAALVAAIALAQKKGAKGSFAFAPPPPPPGDAPTVSPSKAAVLTSIAAPTVAPPSFGALPVVSVVTLAPSASAASTSSAFFQRSAAAAANDDDFDAEFESAPPTSSAAANPFGVGGGHNAAANDFDEEEDDASQPSASSSNPSAALDAEKAAPELLGGAQLAGLTALSANVSARPSTAVSASTAFFGFGDEAADGETAVGGVESDGGSATMSAVGQADAGESNGEFEFAADFPSAPPVKSSVTDGGSAATTPLPSLVIPSSPTPTAPQSPSPSPSPAFPSPRTSTALAAFFAFPPLPSPLPIPSSYDGPTPDCAEAAVAMLEAQERFDELLEVQKFIAASTELPALTARYKEKLAASMDDEDQLPIAMALQAQIKRLKGQQAKEDWLRPLDESAAVMSSPPRLTYAQIVRLLMAVNMSALGSFSSRYAQPFAQVASASSPQAAVQLKEAANRELRSVVGLFPSAASAWRGRAVLVSSFIASQLSLGASFVAQIDRMEVGRKVSDKITAALLPAVSFLTAITALYRVHLRMNLAYHTYGFEVSEGGAAAQCERHWKELRAKVDSSAVWKAYGPTIRSAQLKGKTGDKGGVAPPPLLTVDADKERKAVGLDGSSLLVTCDLCLGRLHCDVDAVGRVEGAEGGEFHSLCANVYQQVVLKRK